MTQKQPSNLFEGPRRAIWNSSCRHLEGSHVGAFVIISSHPLKTQAQTALLNASKALGYGVVNTTVLTLHPTSSNDALTPQEIFRVIESLDPLCVVIADIGAIEDVARAFHARLEIEVPTTLLGHYCCCFNDFEHMLSHETTKQQAWALLKTLPKRG